MIGFIFFSLDHFFSDQRESDLTFLIRSKNLSDRQPPGLSLCLKSLGKCNLHSSIFFLNQIILEQRLDYALAGLLKKTSIEVDGLPTVVEKSKRRTFDGETVRHVKVSPNSDPRTVFLIFLYLEFAAEESEHLGALTYQLRQGSNFHVFAAMERKVGSVHENRFATRMRVDIEICQDLVFVILKLILHKLAQIVGLRKKLLIWVAEEPVNISADERASRVSDCHTVRVDHWDDFENDSLSEGL